MRVNVFIFFIKEIKLQNLCWKLLAKKKRLILSVCVGNRKVNAQNARNIN